jgi:hypothetical protein
MPIDYAICNVDELYSKDLEVIGAASKVAQAVDYLDGLQPAETVDDADELEEAA